MSDALGDAVDASRLEGQRWYASPGRGIAAARVEERLALPGGGALAIVRVDVRDGSPTRYTLPLDPLDATWRSLARMAALGGSASGDGGWILRGTRPHATVSIWPAAPTGVRPLGVDQSNTSVVIDEAWVLKLYRRLQPGRNPEVELAEALARTDRAPLPTFGGSLRLSPPGPSASSRAFELAILQAFIPGVVDEFEQLADAVAAWLRDGASHPPRSVRSDLVEAGRTTAGLHAALAALGGRTLHPRPATPADSRRWANRARRFRRAALRALDGLDRPLAAELRARREELDTALAPLAGPTPPVALTRIHGDLHVGQLIRDGRRFLLADLEGEPAPSLAERRRLDLPLRDVASMLRSLDHAARSAARRAGTAGPPGALDAWIGDARLAFLDGYREGGDPGRYPDDAAMLRALEVEKELYEFGYAASFLPAWRYAPAAGLGWLLDRTP